jgi:hypothetical protein
MKENGKQKRNKRRKKHKKASGKPLGPAPLSACGPTDCFRIGTTFPPSLSLTVGPTRQHQPIFYLKPDFSLETEPAQ